MQLKIMQANRLWGLAAIALLVIGLFGPFVRPVSAADSPANGTCQVLRLPVALSPGGPADQTVVAHYCTPQEWANGPHAIDILTHGASYNSMYWDWPQDPSLYSYVNKTLQAGRATLAYDRVGSGQSSHPLSVAITYDGEAYVLHQLIQWARNSANYSQVTTVGHSYGSMISINEARTYHDTDRLVLTGLLHSITTPGLASVMGKAYPAALDPEFFGQTLDLGYITTEPGTRAADFYDTATADPSVIAYDEAHKDMVTSTGLGAAIAAVAVPAPLNISQGVTAPVLIAIGQEDAIFCNADPITPDCHSDASVRSFEAMYFTAAPSVSAVTIPDTAHDLTLHPSADQSFAAINAWIESH